MSKNQFHDADTSVNAFRRQFPNLDKRDRSQLEHIMQFLLQEQSNFHFLRKFNVPKEDIDRLVENTNKKIAKVQGFIDTVHEREETITFKGYLFDHL